jgi:hypothetical protein
LEDDPAIEMTTRGSPLSPMSPQQYTPPVLDTSPSYSQSQTTSAVHNPIVGTVVSSSSGAENTAAVSSGISSPSANSATGSGMGTGFGQPFTMMNSFRSGGYSRLPGAEGDGEHSPSSSGGGRNDLSTDTRTT